MTAAPMLRELANVRQVAGEPRRRGFFCHEIDLVLFEDEQGICAFQLAYDKPRRERSLSWQRQGGFRHYLVDPWREPTARPCSTPTAPGTTAPSSTPFSPWRQNCRRN